MKKSLLIICAFVFSVATVALAVDAPVTIDLQKAWDVQPEAGKKAQASVIFDHALHQKNNTCTEKCHATDAGGKFKPTVAIKGMGDKNGAHIQCWPCHVEKKVAKGKVCTTCHKK